MSGRASPLVSIVINNFNYERFVGAAIDSALSQHHPRVEVVVVDDGSTDGSPDIIRSYGGDVLVELKENAGQASAMNAGFARASGDIVCFLDADDLLYPSAAVAAVELLADPGVPRGVWSVHSIDEQGQVLGL